MMKRATRLPTENVAELTAKIDFLNKIGVTVVWKNDLAELVYEGDLVGRYSRIELVEETYKNMFWWITDRMKSLAVSDAANGPRNGW